MILAVVIDGDGRPVCSEMWPGNTADVTTLIPVIDRLRARFTIARVCVVADRGLISADTLAELEARRLLYILGVRERSDKLVRELVLKDAGPRGAAVYGASAPRPPQADLPAREFSMPIIGEYSSLGDTPAIIALKIRRPLGPKISVITEDSLTFASSKTA